MLPPQDPQDTSETVAAPHRSSLVGRRRPVQRADTDSMEETPSMPRHTALSQPPSPFSQQPFPDLAPLSPTETGVRAKLTRGRRRLARLLRIQWRMTGPGIISATAYSDPGNYVTCLAAGATAGYKLLFIVLLVSLFAILIQVLSCRLGVVTGLDLAQATRALVLGQNFDVPADAEEREEEGEEGSKTQVAAGGDADGFKHDSEALQLKPIGSAKARPGANSSKAAQRRVLGHIKRLDECATQTETCVWYGRRAVLYLLYFISEGAIIATELAELVGSAIALNL